MGKVGCLFGNRLSLFIMIDPNQELRLLLVLLDTADNLSEINFTWRMTAEHIQNSDQRIEDHFEEVHEMVFNGINTPTLIFLLI